MLTVSGGWSSPLLLLIVTMLEPVVGTLAECLKIIINQALVSLKKPSLNTTYFVILPGESFAAKAFTRRVLPHPWVPKYGF